MKSFYPPIVVILLIGSLIWLKSIQSSFFWACTELLDPARPLTAAAERCMTTAHKFAWFLNISGIVTLLFVIWIVIDKRWHWWVKIATCIAWLALFVHSLSPD